MLATAQHHATSIHCPVEQAISWAWSQWTQRRTNNSGGTTSWYQQKSGLSLQPTLVSRTTTNEPCLWLPIQFHNWQCTSSVQDVSTTLRTCKIWMKRHLPTLQVLEEFGSAMSCCSSALIQSFYKQSGDLLHWCPKPTRHFASANRGNPIPCTTSRFFSRSQGLWAVRTWFKALADKAANWVCSFKSTRCMPFNVWHDMIVICNNMIFIYMYIYTHRYMHRICIYIHIHLEYLILMWMQHAYYGIHKVY